ncbi:MAG: orotidine-5'-phosphate decarboxylase [Cytophagales bacterium]|nr:orotidine-5'-phosphate decarboxylase [Cytophagales bacterium]
MENKLLFHQIKQKKSFLSVGLDTDIAKIPTHLRAAPDPIFEFNRQIIDATLPYAVAYKINTAFYEALGAKGWDTMHKTLQYIPKEIFTIADAKRGDIGNTAEMYAKALFETLDFDAVTLSPYMGKDTIMPFLKYQNKYAIILALTSNQGSEDFEQQKLASGKYLYEQVIASSSQWGTPHNTMYVVGATKATLLADIRKLIPNHFLLIPGVGAQGGSLSEVAQYGLNPTCGLLVNSSRAIIYASSAQDFAAKAAHEAQSIQIQMAQWL